MTPTVEELMAQIGALSAQVSSLSRDNERLAEDNRRLTDGIAEAERESARLKGDLDRLIEQIKLMNARFFGSRSERVVPDQLSLFNDIEASADPAAPEPRIEDALRPHRRRGGKRRLDLDSMETVVIEHEIPEADRACPACGETMAEMKVEVTRLVRLVPARLVVEEHRRHVYVCPACSAANAADGSVPAIIARAPMPAPPIPGSFASASLIAYVINAKYVNALPLYRLEADFGSLGAEISRQDMSNWVLRAYGRWLRLVYGHMRRRLLEHDIIHCDETTVQVLREPGRDPRSKSYVWLFRTAAVDVPICVHEYSPTRARSVVARFLEGWSGTVVTDGYEAYYGLGPSVANVSCLVHARRKFAEVVKSAGGDAVAREAGSAALEGREMIDAILRADGELSGMDPEERRLARLEHVAPKMAAFREWCGQRIAEAVPGMALHNALAYSIRYWPHVEHALTDGRLELTNNIAERSIRPFVVGRKNWLFSDTPRGAEASAAMYSIVVTAKLNGANPRKYVQHLLETLPNMDDPADPDALESLMPWSGSLPEGIMMGGAAARRAAEMRDEPIMDIDPEAFDED